MQIVEVDGHDPVEFARFFAVRDDVRRAEQEFPVGLGQEETRGLFTGNDPDERSNGLGLVDGDTWLGMAWLDWWLTENTHVVDVEIAVDPRFRRQGVASQLLDEVKARALADGRTQLTTSVIASPDGTSSGTAFAEARGFVRKHTELHQVIELPMDDAVVDALGRAVPGYELVQWGDRTPDAWLGEFADAYTVMSRDVPHGDRSVEIQVWTPERLVAREKRRVEQGRFTHTTVAVDGDGRLAAYTQMGGNRAVPERLYQYDTFVRPDHRGRGLGIAVKIPNLRSLQAELDHPAVLHTWNAPENAPMIAVNQKLGFRASDRRVALELELS
ncbi:GNAT family N-acetyltransferase [Kribbella italica]|uniref:GNAT superfamily N-acetyltransferase n=1 Tax=Kribbella italica TaxID=1540520 RepID=A0A7W9J0W0_9ACTN|nr:GNAT family N-acetyltransferase [Kribbella italica]MBB5833591.1 GNAT superfamily N-acetyltransferase [Kribbella italica]